MTYLRRRRALRSWCIVVAAALVLALAASHPAAVTLRLTARARGQIELAYFFFVSMIAGGAPFIAGATLIATLTRALIRRLSRGMETVGAVLSPLLAATAGGCDCSLPALAPALRKAPPAWASFALMWGACCNPAALAATMAIFGWRLTIARLCGGCAVATLQAVSTARFGSAAPAENRRTCDPRAQGGAGEEMLAQLDAGFRNLILCAVVAALALTALRSAHLHVGIVGAAAAAALLSPCSFADALLARVWCTTAGTQLTFMLAAQTIDVRQLVLQQRLFGWRSALAAVANATAGIGFACLAATALHA